MSIQDLSDGNYETIPPDDIMEVYAAASEQRRGMATAVLQADDSAACTFASVQSDRSVTMFTIGSAREAFDAMLALLTNYKDQFGAIWVKNLWDAARKTLL